MCNKTMLTMKMKSPKIAVELPNVVGQLFQYAGVECFILLRTLIAALKNVGLQLISKCNKLSETEIDAAPQMSGGGSFTLSPLLSFTRSRVLSNSSLQRKCSTNMARQCQD